MVKGNQKSKQIIKSLASVVLAMSVLIQFSFVSVNTMSCLSSGEQIVSVGELEGCCARCISNEEMVQAKCCKFENSAKSFHSFHEVKNNFSNQFQVVGLNTDFVFLLNVFAKADVEANQLVNPPPNLFGRQLLIHISKFSV